MFRVLEINQSHDLSYLRANWHRLWEATPGATFFQTLAWLQIYWKHFSEGKRLRVLLILDQEQLVGVVPLVVVNEKTRLGNVRVLTYPLSDWGTHFSVLAKNPRVALGHALRHIRTTRRDWDLIDLRWIGEDDLEQDITCGAMTDAEFIPQPGVWKETAMLDFEGGWIEYLRTRSPKHRSEIRRKLRKFHESGQVEFERYRPGGTSAGQVDPRWDLFDQACQIAKSSWQGNSATGTTITHREVRAYIKDCHVAATELGMLDLAVLRFHNTPVAFCYNYVAEGRVYGLRRGDSPLARDHGLGTVMTALLIRDSFERGDHSLDMGPGSLEAKRRWLTRIATVGRMTHYPLDIPKVQILRLKHWWQASRDRKSGRLRSALDENQSGK